MAAVVPIEVPARIRVNGIIATINIIKGMERMILIIKESGLLTMGQDKILFFSVTTSKIPSGIPIREAISIDIDTMYTVCPSAFMSRLVMMGDIT